MRHYRKMNLQIYCQLLPERVVFLHVPDRRRLALAVCRWRRRERRQAGRFFLNDREHADGDNGGDCRTGQEGDQMGVGSSFHVRCSSLTVTHH